MPVKDRKAAMNRFAIQFEEGFRLNRKTDYTNLWTPPMGWTVSGKVFSICLKSFYLFLRCTTIMIRIFRPEQGTTKRAGSLRLTCSSFAAFVLLLFPTVSSAADELGPLPGNVQKCVNALLAMQNPGAPLPDKTLLSEFLVFTTSPVNLAAPGEKAPAPEKIGKAAGILWRDRLKAPLATTLEYLYNPKMPSEIVYPASVRFARWHPGSNILTLSTPLWKQFGQHKETPLVLRGRNSRKSPLT
jgi:hypothetical protein